MADHPNDIERYLNGEMTPSEMHRLEKRALSDPFLAEALEGAELAGEVFSADVSELHQQLIRKKNSLGWLTPLRVAAAVTAFLIGGYLVYLSINTSKPETMLAVQKDSSQKSLAGARADSLIAFKPKPSGDLLALDEAAPSPKKTALAKEEEYQLETLPPVVSEAAGSTVSAAPQDAKEPASAAPPDTEEIISTADKSSYEDSTQSFKKKMTVAKDETKAAPSVDDVSAGSAQVIRGRVSTFADKASPSGIRASKKEKSIAARTDAQGNYQPASSLPVQTLVFSSEGVETSEVDAGGESKTDIQSSSGKPGDAAGAEAKLSPDYDRTDASFRYAMPEKGMRSFNKYLYSTMRYPEPAKENKIQGNVLIEFTVNADSSLTDFKVLRGIGSGCDEEVIRLVKEGPRWVPLIQQEIPRSSRVRVRMKFALK